MLCSKPFMQGTQAYGCGQCLACRVDRRRLWQWRMVLESFMHSENCFVTLTYDEANYPADGNLSIRDYQLFLKRLRLKLAPERFRFFLVGEYGDQTYRPHYHVCFFGLSAAAEPLIHEAWRKGYVQVGEFNEVTAAYCAGYVVKKLTHRNDSRLKALKPEFARRSLRPGIGAPAMAVLAEQLATDAGMRSISNAGDVPTTLKFGRKSIPLGRYLHRRLRDELGVPEGFTSIAKDAAALERSAAVSALQKAALADDGNSLVTAKSVYLASVQSRLELVLSRSRIHPRRKKL